jgi:hypothetical protein
MGLSSLANRRCGFQPFSCNAVAMLPTLRLRNPLIAKFLTPANTWGAEPVCTRQRSSSLVGRRPRLLVTHPVDSILDSPMTAIPVPQRQGIRPIASNTRDSIRHFGRRLTFSSGRADEISRRCSTRHSSTRPCAGSHFANPAESCTDNRRQHGVNSMALSPTPARVGDLFECSKQAPRIGGWHGSVLLCFVRMAPKSVKTTENSGPVSNADDQGKSNAKL